MKTVQQQFEDGDLDEQYAEYIMSNSAGSRIICNGDTLLQAVEDGYLAEEFVKSLEVNHG